jgi:hypothetical protein
MGHPYAGAGGTVVPEERKYYVLITGGRPVCNIVQEVPSAGSGTFFLFRQREGDDFVVRHFRSCEPAARADDRDVLPAV